MYVYVYSLLDQNQTLKGTLIPSISYSQQRPVGWRYAVDSGFICSNCFHLSMLKRHTIHPHRGCRCPTYPWRNSILLFWLVEPRWLAFARGGALRGRYYELNGNFKAQQGQQNRVSLMANCGPIKLICPSHLREKAYVILYAFFLSVINLITVALDTIRQFW